MNETILQKTYDFLKEIVQVVGKFPKHQRFLIGDKMQGFTTHILEMLIEAYYLPTTEKADKLLKVNIELEKLRYFIRLAYDLGFYPSSRYKQLAEQINEIGRMVGGWLRSIKK